MPRIINFHRSNLDKENQIDEKIEFMLRVDHLIEFLKLDCFDNFKLKVIGQNSTLLIYL